MEDKTGQRVEGDSLERSVCGKDTGPVTDSVFYPISIKEFSANEGLACVYLNQEAVKDK